MTTLLDFSLPLAEVLRSIPESRNDLRHLMEAWLDSNDYLIVPTSGSTGVPQNISINKLSLKNSALRTNRFFEIESSSVIGCALPMRGIGGKMTLIRALIAGCRYIAFPAAIPREEDWKAVPSLSILSLTFPQLVALAEVPIQVNVKHFLLGGAPSGNTQKLVQHFAPSLLWESFGMTESASHFALRNLSAGETAYRLMEGVSVHTDADGGLILHDAVTGIQALPTQDIIHRTSPETFEWKGRKKWVINSGGNKIYPEILEQKLQPMFPYPIAITGIPHPVWNQSIALVIQSTSEEPSAEQIKQYLIRYNLMSWEKPRYFVHVVSFPQTPGHKLDRQAIQTLNFKPL